LYHFQWETIQKTGTLYIHISLDFVNYVELHSVSLKSVSATYNFCIYFCVCNLENILRG